MAQVANVLTSLGESADLETVPKYPFRLDFQDRHCTLELTPFSRQQVEVFVDLERPQAQHVLDFEFVHHDRMEVDQPTIGDFYQGILDAMDSLHSNGSIHFTNEGMQLTRDHFWLARGVLNPVTSVEEAKAALRSVIAQGEGALTIYDGETVAGENPSLAHYWRFMEVLHERRFDPSQADLGRVGAMPMGTILPIDWDAVYTFEAGTNTSELRDLDERFNRCYTVMLDTLQQAIAGNPYLMYSAVRDGMTPLSAIAIEMMERNGCPTFIPVSHSDS